MHSAGPKIAIVLGTRPELIKLADILRLLWDDAALVFTGQHYDADLIKRIFDDCDVPKPVATLAVGSRSRAGQIAAAIEGIDRFLAASKPAAVVVQGDTNTTLAGALAANARSIPLVHVEAGLRSFDRRMPEEHNRVVADHLADLCCAPTAVNVSNLVAEGIPLDRIVETGNTIVGAVERLLPEPSERGAILDRFDLSSGGFVLTTFHRPENVDDRGRLRTVLDELDRLPLPVLFPVHPRTRQRIDAIKWETKGGLLRLTEPVGYVDFLGLSAEAALLVSDSGGVQEEASVVKRPVVVVRRSTERPEVHGTFAELVDVGPEIGDVAIGWLGDIRARHQRLATLPSPYGDGSASKRTVAAILQLIGR